VLPSVRGRERTIAGTILIAAGTSAGAIGGLVMGVLVAAITAVVQFPLAEPAGGTIAGLVGAGAALDAIRLVTGRPGPPTVGRQVPAEWARIFPAPVTAGLYGARLGVGPLTILSTWTWWSFTLAAALLGPGSAVATGAVFGLVKLALVAATSRAAEEADDHHLVFSSLRAGRQPSWAAITLLSLALAVAASGCGASDELADANDRPGPSDEPANDNRGTDTKPAATDPDGNDSPTEDNPAIGDAATGLIAPADLEDVVRTDTTTEPPALEPDGSSVTVSDAAGLVETSSTEHDLTGDAKAGSAADRGAGLADELLAGITDYQVIDGPEADRYLDLRAAADIQPDPTEEVALLETRGYRGGWTRAFRNAHNDVAVASVYQFENEVEAEFYLEDGLITIGGYGGRFFDIPDLPGVRGFAQDISQTDGEATEDLVSLGASFHRGDRWYLLYFLGSPERVTPEVLVPAIAAQLESSGV